MIFLESEAAAAAGDGSLEGQTGRGLSEAKVIEETDTQLPWAPVLIPFGFWHHMEMSGKGTGMEADPHSPCPLPGKSQPFIFPLSLVTFGGFGIPKLA